MAIITHFCCFCTWVMSDCSIKCSEFLPRGLVNHYLINKNFKLVPFSLIGQNFSLKEGWIPRIMCLWQQWKSASRVFGGSRQRMWTLNSKDESVGIFIHNVPIAEGLNPAAEGILQPLTQAGLVQALLALSGFGLYSWLFHNNQESQSCTKAYLNHYFLLHEHWQQQRQFPA